MSFGNEIVAELKDVGGLFFHQAFLQILTKRDKSPKLRKSGALKVALTQSDRKTQTCLPLFR